MTAPPVIKIGPPTSSGTKNSFDKFIAQHSGLSQYKTAIQQWAGEYGVPAMWVAAAIWKESKGQNAPWNPQVQGAGVAQLNIGPNNQGSPPSAAQAVLGRPLTYRDAMDPNTAIQILAYSMTGYASLDDWYTGTWNPGFKPDRQNVLPSAYLKGYSVSVTGHTPQQKVAGSVAESQAKTQNAAFLESQARQTLDPIYLAYTGRKATQAELDAYVKDPVSTYQIEQQLVNPKNNPEIYKSPLWQTESGKYTSWYQDVYGPSAVPPRSVILDGIMHNKDQTGFTADLRAGKVRGAPDYKTSEQYLGNLADATSLYSNIYGAPDAAGQQILQSAVLNGWNTSQLQQYLRHLPQYTSSLEYKSRSIRLAQAMGLIQGTQGQTALAGPAGAAPQPTPVMSGAPNPQQQATAAAGG